MTTRAPVALNMAHLLTVASLIRDYFSLSTAIVIIFRKLSGYTREMAACLFKIPVQSGGYWTGVEIGHSHSPESGFLSSESSAKWHLGYRS
ncbi:hypothetical protein MTBSS4_190010 [Magnetospirillum sp. SS-4]|nr:hypothetical protein MTBSS4_190010 [Magnetospirillum sp. SS-4]